MSVSPGAVRHGRLFHGATLFADLLPDLLPVFPCIGQVGAGAGGLGACFLPPFHHFPLARLALFRAHLLPALT